jgi:hypothetical protein
MAFLVLVFKTPGPSTNGTWFVRVGRPCHVAGEATEGKSRRRGWPVQIRRGAPDGPGHREVVREVPSGIELEPRFNADIRGLFLTSPLAPRGEICPLGVKFPPSTPRVYTLYCLEEWRGKQRITPGGQSLPLGVKLTMGLRVTRLGEFSPFAHWMIVYLSQVFGNYKSTPHFRATFYQVRVKH